MQALHLIHDSLPSACADGSDLEARTAMSNAATLAGLAFSNAFVGASSAPSRRSWTTSASRARSRTPGVGEAEFEAPLPEVAEAAFMDPSMRTNPRMPLVAELVDLLRAG
jgi:alcohol dehydrogenase class IV